MEFLFPIFMLAIMIAILASIWKAFEKAGEPGWASIVPFYNMYVMCRMGGKPGWWFLLMFIPIVGIIVAVLVSIGIAENFGKGAGFGLGLAFLGFIFWPILGFGDAKFRGVAPA